MANTESRNRSVAQTFLDVLASRGIDHVFVNAGTDWAPMVEALALAADSGQPTPEFLPIPHENTAMAMAHGRYLVTGRPQVVGVHNNVGTANALCGLMNAARDNAPILLVAGRTPISETGSPASREVIVHWAQEDFDQAGMVRQHVKWDYEMKAGQRPEEVIDRALDIAMSAPRGPVYLTLPREVLVAMTAESAVPPRKRSFGAITAQPDSQAIESAADMLAAARNPLIITSVVGQDPRNVGLLAEFAARFAIPVIQHAPRCVNLPSSHEMHLGFRPIPLVESADVVLVIDSEVPWIRRDIAAPLTAKVIHVGVDPIYATYPMRSFEDDLAIAGRSATAMEQLGEALAKRISDGTVATRRSRIAERRKVMRSEWQAVRDAAKNARPIDPAWLAACIDGAMDDQTIIVNECGLQLEHIDLRQPGSLFVGPPVGGLGWSLGAGLGVKQAAPEKDVIVVLGDGSYMFANPTPCHYVSAAQNLPLLTIVVNNAGWASVQRAVLSVYPDGSAARRNAGMPLVQLAPSPAFEKVIEASGGYGERVDDPAQLPGAVKRALHVVRSEKRQALLNVICR